MKEDCFYSFPGEIIVCDPNGIILGMNETAIRNYEADGGVKLVGWNVYEHHKEPSRSQVQAIVRAQRTRMYTNRNRLWMICRITLIF